MFPRICKRNHWTRRFHFLGGVFLKYYFILKIILQLVKVSISCQVNSSRFFRFEELVCFIHVVRFIVQICFLLFMYLLNVFGVCSDILSFTSVIGNLCFCFFLYYSCQTLVDFIDLFKEPDFHRFLLLPVLLPSVYFTLSSFL